MATFLFKLDDYQSLFSNININNQYAFRCVSSEEQRPFFDVSQNDMLILIDDESKIRCFLNIIQANEDSIVFKKLVELGNGVSFPNLPEFNTTVFEIDDETKKQVFKVTFNSVSDFFANKECLNEHHDNYPKVKDKPFNRIVFGAPGTGKSYKLEQDRIPFGDNYERITFHPDYSYAQFVGTYKPVNSKEKKDIISYEYIPGPFIRVLVKALNNPNEQFLLLIEEINRASVAAVFGDVFQLLDRAPDGSSIYPIEASEDLIGYLNSVGIKDSKIKIPSNMFIWATMNSADQGVFPMDTAFKRRWDFEYIGINSCEKDMANSTVILGTGEYEHTIKWNDLRHAINDYLAELGINEDKQLGPYFIGRNIVVPMDGTNIDSTVFSNIFKNKVLMYLFDDAAKQRRNSLFEGVKGNKNRYSTICDAFDKKGIHIFNERITNATLSPAMENDN
ncbi:MAG: AAA family ATPase [Candidatus Ornithospirochaeta sp.]